MTKSTVEAALGRVASGVYVLTAQKGDQSTGMLASWVMQAGFDPPMVTVAVKLGRYVCDWLSEGQPFVLNLVGDSQTSLLKHFGKGFEPGAPAFEGLQTSTARCGGTLLDDALGHLECRPGSHVDSGDHRIFLAEVIGGGWSGDGRPMVHIRTSGARY